MRIEEDDSRHDLLGAKDDAFHLPDAFPDLVGSRGRRWLHETAWFWWFVPEHGLGGWLYNWVRPNIGTSGGGAWVWDDSSWVHFEVPYYACYSNLALPERSDPACLRFPSGVTVECLEPLKRYHLGFADRDLIGIDLDFAAVMSPWVPPTVVDPPRVFHFDQVGRVTGTVSLQGSSYAVDCLAIRDRTWSVRPERWKDGRIGYCNACNDSTGVAFLAGSAAGTDGRTEERIRSDYFVKEGRRAAMVDGIRVVERDPDHGFLRRITVDATDSAGRTFRATGVGLSRMAIPVPGVHGVVWASLVDWTLEGQQAWGEDQDAWPIPAWSAFRRAGRS